MGKAGLCIRALLGPGTIAERAMVGQGPISEAVTRFLAFLETKNPGLVGGLLLLLFYSLVRCVEEGVIFGFPLPVSEAFYGMWIVDFAFFSMNFLAGSLLIAVCAEKPARRVLSLVLWGYGIILLPPLMDAILLGRTQPYTYGDPERFFTDLLTGFVSNPGIGKGILLEFLFIGIGSAAYVYWNTRSFPRTMAVLLGLYGLFALSATPQIFPPVRLLSRWMPPSTSQIANPLILWYSTLGCVAGIAVVFRDGLARSLGLTLSWGSVVFVMLGGAGAILAHIRLKSVLPAPFSMPANVVGPLLSGLSILIIGWAPVPPLPDARQMALVRGALAVILAGAMGGVPAALVLLGLLTGIIASKSSRRTRPIFFSIAALLCLVLGAVSVGNPMNNPWVQTAMRETMERREWNLTGHESSLRTAIRQGMEFLVGHQGPSGEFPLMASTAPDMRASFPMPPVVFHSAWVLQAMRWVREDGSFLPSVWNGLGFLLDTEDPVSDRGLPLWGFFGGHGIFLDPDMDDTLQALLALDMWGFRTGRDELQALLSLRDSAGVFRTWIAMGRPLPPPESRVPVLDPVINAHALFFLALHGMGPQGLIDYVNRMAGDFPENYTGIYYPDPLVFAYAASRAYGEAGIGGLDPAREAIMGFFVSQRFSPESASPLRLALALTAAANFQEHVPWQKAAVERLLNLQGPDGGWPLEMFFVAGPGHMPLYYGSRELTAALCLEALWKTQGFQ